MRHLALPGLLVCLMAVPSARAQELVTPEAACTYVGAAFDEAIYAFAANQQAEAFVTEVMSVVRLPRNFTVQAANVPRIAAIRDGERRLILYNTYVLQQARQPGPARWAALRELAHAAGHHLLHHDLGTGPQRPLEELEADDFSGYVLARLRATPAQAVTGLDSTRAITSDLYPAWPLRLEALRAGLQKGDTSEAHYFGFAESAPPPKDKPPPPPPPTSGPPPNPSPVGPPDAVTDDDTVPTFPWPPPRASAFVTIPPDRLGPSPPLSLQAAAARLEAALEAAGYGERSYYAVPDGFALVARLEQILPDGTPQPVPDRWSTRVRPMKRFSLVDYFRALFTATPGFYRIVVFVVSSQPFSQQEEGVSAREGQAWLSGGLNTLPTAIAERPFTARHRCTALIYTFEKPDTGASLRFQDPSTIPGRIHLERARLWEALGNR